MKMFSEEQVRKAYRDGNVDGFSHVSALEKCIDSLIPINLPSDEQTDSKSVESWCPSIFIGAAKWVIEQIKQQEIKTLDLTTAEMDSSKVGLFDGAAIRESSSRDLDLSTALKKVTSVSDAAAIWAEYMKESEPMKFHKSLKEGIGYVTYSTFRAGADWQAERMYSEKYMLDFAWFLVESVSGGGPYTNDKVAHFDGCYLEQFKKK